MRVCACVCVNVRVCGCSCVVCVCVREEGGKEKYVWVDLTGFFGNVVCAECLPRVHN